MNCIIMNYPKVNYICSEQTDRDTFVTQRDAALTPRSRTLSREFTVTLRTA